MALITAYFDAIGAPDSTAFVSLGGLVSTADGWITFTHQWEECLCSFGVSMLHMRDFCHSRGDFSSWRGDEPRRRRFLNRLMWIIEACAEYTVASSVPTADYKIADQKYCLSEFMRPYSYVATTCVSAIFPWARKMSVNPNNIRYIFEKGDADQTDLGRCWDSSFPDFMADPIFLGKWAKHPGSNVCAQIRPFEATDLIAYENYKANIVLERSGGEAFLSDLRKPIQRLRGLPGAENWRICNTQDLEKICVDFQVTRRPVASSTV
jgi:hypothetical protein